VAATLMSLHVAPDAEGLAASGVRALERFLSGMRVAVDPERTRTRERLVARLTDVTILRLRE
jgi:predicted secreted Zn-dependent protease